MKRPETVAIYCPLWHNYDHATSWKGDGWCEWELVKSAVPRFGGHYQPYKPSWGHFDESNPSWSAKEIDLAATHGIDVFLVDWYWYSGVKIMEEALENGLLKADNRQQIRFALMWANHDWSDYFPAPFGEKWNSWLPSRHSSSDWHRVIDYCIEEYFCKPNYWQVEGRLFFSIFQPFHLIGELGGIRRFRKTLEKTQKHLMEARLPPLHLNAMVGNENKVQELAEAGYESTTMYNIVSGPNVSPNLTIDYQDLMEEHYIRWDRLTQTGLPHMPVVTMGWDVTPRCEKSISWPFPLSPRTGKRNYPYGPVVTGNSPDRFGQLLHRGYEHAVRAKPVPNAVLINAWNEWTEGSILLPEGRYGTGHLDVIHSVQKSIMADPL